MSKEEGYSHSSIVITVVVFLLLAFMFRTCGMSKGERRVHDAREYQEMIDSDYNDIWR